MEVEEEEGEKGELILCRLPLISGQMIGRHARTIREKGEPLLLLLFLLLLLHTWGTGLENGEMLLFPALDAASFCSIVAQ